MKEYFYLEPNGNYQGTLWNAKMLNGKIAIIAQYPLMGDPHSTEPIHFQVKGSNHFIHYMHHDPKETEEVIKDFLKFCRGIYDTANLTCYAI